MREPNIIRLKLVKSNADKHRRKLQAPHEELPDAGHPLVRDIVNDECLEADVGVDEDARDEYRVQEWIVYAGNERREGQRDETGGQKALEGPVVAAVRWRRRWNWGWVIDFNTVSGRVLFIALRLRTGAFNRLCAQCQLS